MLTWSAWDAVGSKRLRAAPAWLACAPEQPAGQSPQKRSGPRRTTFPTAKLLKGRAEEPHGKARASSWQELPSHVKALS